MSPQLHSEPGQVCLSHLLCPLMAASLPGPDASRVGSLMGTPNHQGSPRPGRVRVERRKNGNEGGSFGNREQSGEFVSQGQQTIGVNRPLRALRGHVVQWPLMHGRRSLRPRGEHGLPRVTRESVRLSTRTHASSLPGQCQWAR